LSRRSVRGAALGALSALLGDAALGMFMTIDALQRAYWRWQWANGTAMYAAKHGSRDELAAAEKAALDRYEEYLRAKVAYYGPQERGELAA
jgi:hypothetical protein